MSRRLKMKREADAKAIQADKRKARNANGHEGHDEHAADRGMARKPNPNSEPGAFPERGGVAPRAGETPTVDTGQDLAARARFDPKAADRAKPGLGHLLSFGQASESRLAFGGSYTFADIGAALTWADKVNCGTSALGCEAVQALAESPASAAIIRSRHQEGLGERLKPCLLHVRIRGCCGYGGSAGLRPLRCSAAVSAIVASAIEAPQNSMPAFVVWKTSQVGRSPKRKARKSMSRRVFAAR